MTNSNAQSRGASATLAAFIADLTFDAIPTDVTGKLKLNILDGIGCCLVGARLPWTCMVADMVAAEGGVPAATVFGMGRTAPLTGAVLINSTAGHAFELDDIHRDAILHPNSIAVPVALNVAEHMGGASGPGILTAIVAGYEAGNRIGAAAGTELLLRGFHPQGVIGPFCAAATAAKLMRLDPGQTLNALGIAGSLGSGLMAAQEGAMVKRLHSGRAAEAGVRAADLAARGFTGIENLAEAEYGGFLAAFSGKIDTARITNGLGTVWETTNTGYKPHATVTSIHCALDALKAIMAANGLKAADIAKITARISNPTYVHCAWPYAAQSVTAAQMNIFYCLAMIAFHGEAFTDQFREDVIGDVGVMDFIRKISAEVDPEIEALGASFRHMACVRVETVDGRAFEHEERIRRGSPENPVSQADLERKFDALAGPVLGREKAAGVKAFLAGLDRQPDVRPLMDLLAG